MSEQQPDQKKHWRSLEELEGSQIASSEFASTPYSEGSETAGVDGHSRREFLKLMGASFALMGASACTRRPVENIVSYVKRPEDVLPGVANWYASSCTECDSACGILVKTREGRPLKFEGNPKDPYSKGGLCARGQASILNLYDPDRLQAPLAPARQDKALGVTWDELDAKIISKFQAAKAAGGRVRVLTSEISSPSTNKVIQEFLSGFSAGKKVVFEPLGAEEVLSASELSYGSRVFPHYRLEKADLIVSFGADFLGTWGAPVEFAKAFSAKRRVSAGPLKGTKPQMSRFVAFESVMTLTGSNADERFRVKSGDEFKVAGALAHELIVTQGRSRYAADAEVKAALAPFDPAPMAAQLGVSTATLRKVAAELWENRGKSVVFGGGHIAKGDSGIALEVLVNLLNSALENEGSTIDGTLSPVLAQTSYQDLIKLIADMKAGQVDVLVIYKNNPAYSLPKALGFEEALSKVGTIIDFSTHFDETARKADFVCALPHSTEAWGDVSSHVGTYGVVQPTIAPLYATRGLEDSFIVWAKRLGFSGAIASRPNWHEYLKGNWQDTVYHQAGSAAPFALFWENALRNGVVDVSAAKGTRESKARSFSSSSLKAVPKPAFASATTLALYPKVSQYDGRNANNGWLQELPDTVTKATWDNYAMVSPGFAKTLGVKQGDVVQVRTDLVTLELPVFVQPGLHDQTIAAAVGYGRKGAGRVGDGHGVNVFPFATAGNRALGMSALSVHVEKTGRTYDIATTQRHDSMEGREPVREATLKEYKRNPKAGNEEHETLTTIWSKHEYPGYRWGMAIDLNACTGCSACVTACQAENNIPIVGKQYVLSNKEMHWLRIDRYYSGRAEQPETVHQPMLCQHCENAPCETVCPVLATMHDHEGLNQQVYNRCVGTRYCANNCPYKVRRFNWFTFTDVAPSLKLQYNPDITVRTRGVMEKCSFCMQRIRQAKDTAKDENRKVKDSDLKTACQQSCPTDAIVFGDINNPDSQVSQVASDTRGYHVLEELNTRPSITYLTKIRNTEA